MGKKIFCVILALLMLFPVFIVARSFSADAGRSGREQAEAFFADKAGSLSPCTRPDGQPFTIAYVDIDPYPASGEMLYFFIQQMADTGWINLPGPLPFDSADTDAKEMINYLADLDLGPYVRFSRDANYYIAVDDEQAYMESLQGHADKKDVDLILCLGTSPGELVINRLGITDIPVMVYFSVDPVSAGLSDTEEYSGQKNVWCHTSSDVYLNQLRFYYNNYAFTNIGAVYYSESVGAMNQYRSAAAELGCAVSERKIETLTAADPQTSAQYYAMLKDTFLSLIEEDHIDAFLLGTDIIKDVARIPEMLKLFEEKGIPVFVQNGDYYVRYGALMTVTASDAKAQAPFAVSAMAEIFNGRDPGSVYQKFVISPSISINLTTAGRIGYKPAQELLLAADRIYYLGEEVAMP